MGPQTEPVRRLLDRIGFRYVSRIDPFDGGPHYEARLAEVTLVRAHRRAALAREPLDGPGQEWLVGFEPGHGRSRFRAVRTEVQLGRREVRLPAAAVQLLGASAGDRLHLVPFE